MLFSGECPAQGLVSLSFRQAHPETPVQMSQKLVLGKWSDTRSNHMVPEHAFLASRVQPHSNKKMQQCTNIETKACLHREDMSVHVG